MTLSGKQRARKTEETCREEARGLNKVSEGKKKNKIDKIPLEKKKGKEKNKISEISKKLKCKNSED